MKLKPLIVVLGMAVSLVMTGAFSPATAAPQCDRQCLVDLMQQYLAAMVKHDPKAVPFSKTVKFTENTDKSIEVLPVGKGLWETASGGPSDFQVFAADPEAQAVACLVIMKEKDKDIFLGARLKLANGKIAEAEHIVVRGNVNGSQPSLAEPRPGLLMDIAPADRMKREELSRIGLTYYDALTGEDGTLAPMAPECERHENGMTTASGKPLEMPGPAAKPDPSAKPLPIPKPDPEMEKMMKAMAAMPRDCTGQISTGTFAYITEIKPRRLVVADVQKGLAVGFSMFYHDGSLKTMKIKGVPGVDSMPGFAMQFNLPAVHIFKIKKGKIYEIEANGASLPYGIPSGWE
jgi:hypothetical protein